MARIVEMGMSVPVGLPGEQRKRSLASGYLLKAVESWVVEEERNVYQYLRGSE